MPRERTWRKFLLLPVLRDLEDEEEGTKGTALGEEAESLAEGQKRWAVQALLGQPRTGRVRLCFGGLTANMGAPPGMSSAMEGDLGGASLRKEVLPSTYSKSTTAAEV